MSAADPARPKLVVGIVVDQLRTDYIEYLQNYFGQRGFRTLMNDGVYFSNVDFKVGKLDAPAATAMLYTGAYPYRTGVPSSMVYDHTVGRRVPALAEVNSTGGFTNDAFTPANLRLSTLSDEIAIEGAGLATIYALSPDPQQAVIMAGHAGSNACWINNTSGNWASSSYYKSLPTPVSNRNFSTPLANRIDTMQWKPSYDIKSMPGLPNHKKQAPFKYTFSHSEKNVYNRFANSPLANVEVTDLAIECLKNFNPGGASSAIDMLNIGYTVAPYKYVRDNDYRAELTDSYLRLDKQLGRLFDAIDKYVGADNAVIWLSSTGYFDNAATDDKKYRIPTGEFSLKRAESLLNSYLSAQHGNADYVSAIKDGQIYFDHKLLEDKGLNLNDVISDARAFISRMSGISDSFTILDILSPSRPEEESLRLATDPKYSGDIFLKFNPGWNVNDDMGFETISYPVRDVHIVAPAFIMAPGLKAQRIDTPVDATQLAPTVAGVLRIRSPNGSISKPLMLKK